MLVAFRLDLIDRLHVDLAFAGFVASAFAERVVVHPLNLDHVDRLFGHVPAASRGHPVANRACQSLTEVDFASAAQSHRELLVQIDLDSNPGCLLAASISAVDRLEILAKDDSA